MVKILLHHLQGGKPTSSLEYLKSSLAVICGRKCVCARAGTRPTASRPAPILRPSGVFRHRAAVCQPI